jgi:hypothetical protein
MSHKASLACACAIAAAATLAGIGPALSHTIVGNRLFPATLAIDDPGVNDELGLPTFSYFANPDNSNEFDFNGAWQKTITYNLSFSIADTFTHLTNALRADGTIGTINGWKQLRTQLKYVPYQNDEHEFIVSVAGQVAWGETGNDSIAPDGSSLLTVKGFFGKGFGDLENEAASLRGNRRNRLHMVNPPVRRDGGGPIRQPLVEPVPHGPDLWRDAAI